MIKKESTRINVTISKKVHELLKKESEYEGRSVSNMAYKIIMDHYGIKENNK